MSTTIGTPQAAVITVDSSSGSGLGATEVCDKSPLALGNIIICNIPVNKNIAMTGEVTLRGNILPIGGLKEKLLAAHRARIPKVLIPEDNKKDLAEIPKKILNDLEIITVQSVDEVLRIALTKELKPIEWIEVESLPKSKSGEKTATIPN